MKLSLRLPLLFAAFLLLNNQVQAQTKTTAKTTTSLTAEDTVVQKQLLGETTDLTQTRADELPDLFGRFMTNVRDERRSWTYRNWSDADKVLTRLVARYNEVHSELPLEERVRIRAFQTEFRTLKGTRKTSE